jgi:hypothetical protein
MRIILFLTILSITLLDTSCKTFKKSTEFDLIKNQIPPNAILISKNIYCDQTEV